MKIIFSRTPNEYVSKQLLGTPFSDFCEDLKSNVTHDFLSGPDLLITHFELLGDEKIWCFIHQVHSTYEEDGKAGFLRNHYHLHGLFRSENTAHLYAHSFISFAGKALGETGSINHAIGYPKGKRLEELTKIHFADFHELSEPDENDYPYSPRFVLFIFDALNKNSLNSFIFHVTSTPVTVKSDKIMIANLYEFQAFFPSADRAYIYLQRRLEFGNKSNAINGGI